MSETPDYEKMKKKELIEIIGQLESKLEDKTKDSARRYEAMRKVKKDMHKVVEDLGALFNVDVQVDKKDYQSPYKPVNPDTTETGRIIQFLAVRVEESETTW